MKILDKYTNDQSRFPVIKGSLVHYRDEGQGPTLLLIHGAFSSLHTFNSWVDILSSKYRILRLDLPGFGLSQVSWDHEYSIERYLEIISEFLRLMVAERCTFVGSSLGGWLAWEYAIKYPKAVEKLVLIDSGGFLEDKYIPLPFKMARTPIVKQILKYVVQKNLVMQFLHEVYGDTSKITPELEELIITVF